MASAQPRGYSATKDQLADRLTRIEGQVRGIERMVDEERYCIDVLTQISAVQAALDKVALGLLDAHARTCVVGARGRGPARRAHRGADGRGGPAQPPGLTSSSSAPKRSTAASSAPALPADSSVNSVAWSGHALAGRLSASSCPRTRRR